MSQATKLVETLRKSKSESSSIDAKETLNLKENGDCAVFIRHIAAIANTGQKSYLLIGIENKSWILKGIPEGSPLLDVDSSKQQMNQILRARIDPPIQVDYQTLEMDGKTIGFVGVEGNNPPYVISMNEPKFGGSKTKGDEIFIYKGVVYIRNGADSIPATRQSEIASIFNGKRDTAEIVLTLFLIGLIISVGVGLGSVLIEFKDPILPAICGGFFGTMVGWMLNKRLSDSLGRFTIGWIDRWAKLLGGVLWGGLLGSILSYLLVQAVINGKGSF